MKRCLMFLAVMALLVMLTATAVAEEVTISYVCWDYSVVPEKQEAVAAFQEKYPDIKVEVIDVSAADYTDKLTIMLSAGQDVDIISIKDMPTYSAYIERNWLEPLNAYVESDGDFDPAVFSGLMDEIKVDGNYYGVPYRSDVWLLFYNKGLFEQAGVPYPGNDITWEEFAEKARLISSGSGAERIYGAFIHTWKSLAMNLGVQTGEYTLVDGKYDFLKPAYELYLKMMYEDESVMTFGEAVTSSAHYATQFESDRVGMIYMGSWNIGRMISDAKAGVHDIDWGMVKSPHWPGQEAGVTIGNVTPLAINANSDKKDAAWKFVKFFSQEEGAKIFARNGILPALINDATLEVYTSSEGFPENAMEALDAHTVYLEFPPHPQGRAIDKILQEEHELIMIKDKTIEEGIADMERRVQEAKEW